MPKAEAATEVQGSVLVAEPEAPVTAPDDPPAEPVADPPVGGEGQEKPAQQNKTTYVLFEEVEAVVTLPEGGELETVVWLPIGEQSASGGASALGHQFAGKAMPAPDRSFRAVPVKSTRRFHPPAPNPVPSFREAD